MIGKGENGMVMIHGCEPLFAGIDFCGEYPKVCYQNAQMIVWPEAAWEKGGGPGCHCCV